MLHVQCTVSSAERYIYVARGDIYCVVLDITLDFAGIPLSVDTARFMIDHEYKLSYVAMYFIIATLQKN